MYQLIPLKSLENTIKCKINYLWNKNTFQFNHLQTIHLKSNSFYPNLNNKLFPWINNINQEYSIIVLSGKKYIEIMNPISKKIDLILLTPDYVLKNNHLYQNTPSMLILKDGFYRFKSKSDGFISLNLSHSMIKQEEKYFFDFNQDSIKILKERLKPNS